MNFRSTVFGLSVISAFAAFACTGDGDLERSGPASSNTSAPPVAKANTADPAQSTLGSARCLRAASLELKHRTPAAEDLADLAAGRKHFADVIEGYLGTPEFRDVVLN
jgi:hypothetical protein